MIIRTARLSDAEAMSRILTDIIAVTQRQRPHDQDFVRDTYINNPYGILCSVAEDENGEVLGFQSLIRAAEDNKYGVTAGWGIIGTHVSPNAARRGSARPCSRRPDSRLKMQTCKILMQRSVQIMTTVWLIMTQSVFRATAPIIIRFASVSAFPDEC